MYWQSLSLNLFHAACRVRAIRGQLQWHLASLAAPHNAPYQQHNQQQQQNGAQTDGSYSRLSQHHVSNINVNAALIARCIVCRYGHLRFTAGCHICGLHGLRCTSRIVIAIEQSIRWRCLQAQYARLPVLSGDIQSPETIATALSITAYIVAAITKLPGKIWSSGILVINVLCKNVS